MGLNKDALNNFAAGMADIQMDRNPLAEEVIVIFNTVQRDHYQDSITTEEGRLKKMAVVSKNVDMSYVQQLGDVLLEDDEHSPWVISMTVTGMFRLPKTDDQILIEGLRYYVSYVKPSNRSIDSIINISVYPDRSDIDELKVFSLSRASDGCVDILYGGKPVEMAFTLEAINDKTKRIPFKSIMEFELLRGTLLLFDSDGHYVKFNYSL